MSYPLTNRDIDRLLGTHPATKEIYKGFLHPRDDKFIDEKIAAISPPSLYVINTDYIDKPGEHWLLVVYLKEKTYFIDPFGLNPAIYRFYFLVERDNNPVTYNTYTVQDFHSRSIVCGHFVVIYAILISKGYNLKDIEYLFHPTDTVINDKIVSEILKWLILKMSL